MQVPIALFVALMAFPAPSRAQPTLQRRATGPNAAAKANGRWFGSCFDKSWADDPTVMKYYNDPNFIGELTPENSMKPSSIDAGGGKYNFDGGDFVVAQAKKIGAKIRCHFLTGPNQNGASLGSLNGREATLSYLDKYIGAVMEHFGTACHSWDVVNEALTQQGGIRNDVPWYGKIGSDFVEQIFKIATKHAPSGVKLCYNDFNMETSPQKLEGAIGLVSKIKAAGGRIDCIGFESHISTSYHPTLEAYTSVLKKAASVVGETPITELDVADSANNEDLQAEVYGIATKACLAVPSCSGIVVWGLSDKHGWLTGKKADLLDDNGKEKPAMQSVLSALASTSASSANTDTTPPDSVTPNSTTKTPETTTDGSKKNPKSGTSTLADTQPGGTPNSTAATPGSHMKKTKSGTPDPTMPTNASSESPPGNIPSTNGSTAKPPSSKTKKKPVDTGAGGNGGSSSGGQGGNGGGGSSSGSQGGNGGSSSGGHGGGGGKGHGGDGGNGGHGSNWSNGGNGSKGGNNGNGGYSANGDLGGKGSNIGNSGSKGNSNQVWWVPGGNGNGNQNNNKWWSPGSNGGGGGFVKSNANAKPKKRCQAG